MKSHEIIETSQTPALLLWWQWLGVAIATIALLILIRLIIKNKKTTPPTPVQNLAQALHTLTHIRNETFTTRDLATRLSLTTRQYLQAQFNDPALFETHQEFNHRSQDIKKLPLEAASRLSSYLTELANLKYAPDPESPEIQDTLIKNTEDLLRGLDSTVPKNIDPMAPQSH